MAFDDLMILLASSSLMKINDKKFNKEMQNNFNNFFGKMKLIGKRYSYPMITTYSKKFVAHRFALIGDAAVGMHPVTAHGFNLSLKGLDILINEIKMAIKNKMAAFEHQLLLQKHKESQKEKIIKIMFLPFLHFLCFCNF